MEVFISWHNIGRICKGEGGIMFEGFGGGDRVYLSVLSLLDKDLVGITLKGLWAFDER